MPAPDHGLPADPAVRTRWRPGVGALITGIVAVVSVAALLLVAPPGEVLDQISDMNPAWVVGAIGFEFCSCLGYVIIFRRFFPEPPGPVSRQVAWIAMGAGAILPGGNLSSAAATGLLLRRHGIGTRRLLERCGALLCLLTLFGFFVNGVAGSVLLVGLPGGPHDLLHAGGPILVSVGVLSLAALAMWAARRAGPRAPRVVRGLATVLEGAWTSVRAPQWRLLGGAGFFLLDIGALWAACEATGHSIGWPALILAYCIGYLATTIPVPAGIGVLDSGLAATLVIYGFSPVASVGAVLVYHAIAIWVPALGGLVAWLPTRGQSLQVAAAAAPAPVVVGAETVATA